MAKTLVIYYSAEGHTKRIAEIIAKTLNADIFEIIPKEPYTKEDLDWMNPESRSTKQHDGELSQEVELASSEVPNWDDYDTVFVGYPIWWGYAAYPAASFMAGRDFKNKTVIPFCTSHSSGIGDSDLKLKHSILPPLDNVKWYDAERFYQDAAETEVVNWAKKWLTKK